MDDLKNESKQDYEIRMEALKKYEDDLLARKKLKEKQTKQEVEG